MEPSIETFEEIGRLCIAWAYLESVTETTVWGVIDADERLGPIITARLDLRGCWQMILEHAPKKLDAGKCEALRKINKDLTPVMRDRNIIVHGLVHALIVVEGEKPARGTKLPLEGQVYARQPCWTVFRGAEAGKNFAISKAAVETVRLNIQKITERAHQFNEQNSFTAHTRPGDQVEPEWPKPL